MARSETSSFVPPGIDSNVWEIFLGLFNALMLFASLTAMILIRRKVGYRNLQPGRILFIVGVLLVIAHYTFNPIAPLALIGSPPPAPPSHPGEGIAWTVFAGLFLVSALVQRRKRRIEIANGVCWHTWSTGLSYFEFLPLPTDIIHIYVDSVFCFIAGMLISYIAPPLGQWLMFSAVAFGISERALFQAAMERDLDLLDGLFEAEVQASVMQHFTSAGKGEAADRPSGIAETAGIPTGIAPDIRKQIALRQKRAPQPVSPTPLPPPLTYSAGNASDEAPAEPAGEASDDDAVATAGPAGRPVLDNLVPD